MKKKQAQQLGHGLCVIHWKEQHGGGSSMASVGSDTKGRRWFAATNWLVVPCFDWRAVKRVVWVKTSR